MQVVLRSAVATGGGICYNTSRKNCTRSSIKCRRGEDGGNDIIKVKEYGKDASEESEGYSKAGRFGDVRSEEGCAKMEDRRRKGEILAWHIHP